MQAYFVALVGRVELRSQMHCQPAERQTDEISPRDRFRHRAIVRMEAIFFTAENLSMMALRATAEGGAP